MTLVASFTFAGVQALIGDVLLSRTEDPSARHVELPSLGDSRRVIAPEWEISLQLGQKIHLVNPYLAVAYSNRMVAAMQAMQMFHRVAGNNPLSTGELDRTLNNIRANADLDELKLVGLACCTDGPPVSFGCRALGLFENGHPFAPALVSGSGWKDFAGDVDQLAKRPPLLMQGPREYLAFIAGQTLAARYFAREMHSIDPSKDETLNPLLHLYGGGWEFAHVVNGVVEKVGDTTFSFWEAQASDGAVTVRPPTLCLRRHYIGAELVHRWLRGADALNWSVPWTDQRCSIIHPVIGASRLDLSDPSRWPPFSARFHVQVVVVRIGDAAEPEYVLVWVNDQVAPGGPRPTSFQEDTQSEATHVSVQPETLTQLQAVLTEQMFPTARTSTKAR